MSDNPQAADAFYKAQTLAYWSFAGLVIPLIGVICGALSKSRLMGLKANNPKDAVAIRKTYQIARWGYGISVVLLVLEIAVGGLLWYAAVSPTSGQPPTASTQASSSSDNGLAAPAVSSTPPTTVLLDQSGSGEAQTKPFTTTGEWTVAYTFDCSAWGSSGNFQFDVANTDGSDNLDNGANDLAMSGGNTDYYYDAGQHYLSVNSECDWHVVVKG